MRSQKKNDDKHGQKRLPLSIISSWASQFVLVISGFVIPPLIDKDLGQNGLGVWYFAWALISHFAIIQAGIAGSVNRFVSMYRSTGETEKMSVAVSSVAGALRVIGCIVLIVTFISAYFIPNWMESSLNGYVFEARWLIILLGTSLSIQIPCSVYGGILTGCHRWDIHNVIYILTYLCILIGMVTTLSLGYGLIGLGCVSLFCESSSRFIRFLITKRICPEIVISRKNMSWVECKNMMRFGGLLSIREIAQLLLTGSLGILITSHFGPGFLALYQSPASIVKSINSFIQKFALTLVPTFSSLNADKNNLEIAKLTIKSTQFSVYLSLPCVLFLSLLGDNLLGVWIRTEYANLPIIAAISSICLFNIAHAPLYFILVGIDRHGKLALWWIASAACGLISTFIYFTFSPGNLAAAAIISGLPIAFVNLIIIPHTISKFINIPIITLYAKIWTKPLLTSIPFTVSIACLAKYSEESYKMNLILGCSVGVVLIGIPYWFLVLPKSLKKKLTLKRT